MVRCLLALFVLFGSIAPPVLASSPVPPPTAEQYKAQLEAEMGALRADTAFRLEYIGTIVLLLDGGGWTLQEIEYWQWLISFNRLIILSNSARIAQIQAALDALENGV